MSPFSPNSYLFSTGELSAVGELPFCYCKLFSFVLGNPRVWQPSCGWQCCVLLMIVLWYNTAAPFSPSHRAYVNSINVDLVFALFLIFWRLCFCQVFHYLDNTKHTFKCNCTFFSILLSIPCMQSYLLSAIFSSRQWLASLKRQYCIWSDLSSSFTWYFYSCQTSLLPFILQTLVTWLHVPEISMYCTWNIKEVEEQVVSFQLWLVFRC